MIKYRKSKLRNVFDQKVFHAAEKALAAAEKKANRSRQVLSEDEINSVI